MRVFTASQLAAAVVLALAATACSGHPAARGTVTGRLYGVGGPAAAPSHPWPGTVTLTGDGGRHEVTAGTDGTFLAAVSPGSYLVTGRSPLYQGGAALCRAAAVVNVTAGHTSRADVLCQMR